MGRRTRMRHVKRTPNNIYFVNVPKSDLDKENFVILNVSEFEAMRLKHYIKLNQKDSADKMGVSQPTFSRILDSAHQKTTKALIEGKIVRIFGGNINYKKTFIGYGCLDCNMEWQDENASKERKSNCPKCNSKSTYYLVKEPV